ncbi:hypothetical protein D3C87_1471430 [compost metagenome]
MAGRHLAAPEQSLGALAALRLEAHHHMGVVVELAARHKTVEIGGKLFQLQPGDEGAEIIGMRADVAGRAAGARAGRIGAPGRLLLARLLDILRQPVLRIFHLHQPDRADVAVLNHLARLAHHRIAGVVVGEHEQCIAVVGRLLQLLRIR